MIELPVGSRFYLDDKLVEVAEGEDRCSSCVFYKRIFEDKDYDEYLEWCDTIKCYGGERKDRTDVFFKEVNIMAGKMIDLPIGVKFSIGDKLIEVAEDAEEEHLCSDCVFRFNTDVPCEMFECYKHTRKDKKDVYFKEVEE